jgi:AraC family transcriptional regulator of adaptative response/methylated-DNA-[protein]-cysteine methyltransferase
VAFHRTCAEAEAAGFRPCKRCQPNGASLEEHHAAMMARACRAIESAGQAPTLAALARSVGLSAFYFHRLFRKIIGVTPKAYADSQRALRVRVALEGKRTVTEAIYRAGFNSNSRFYSKAPALLGMPARRFRQGGAGETICFAISECFLGSVLVASSNHGICAILLGEDPLLLAGDLQARFPGAEIIGGNRSFAKKVEQIIKFIEEPRTAFRLPLDIRGTAFQQKVWQALREIPLGRTASYTEIAHRLGKPHSVRAVAGACAANALAVVIPCHRVLRRDGALSGYRWGVDRKRALLSLEAKAGFDKRASGKNNAGRRRPSITPEPSRSRP